MITEHDVKMRLRGRPRWWTISNANGSREVIRVTLKASEDYAEDAQGAPSSMILFAILPTGQFKWPPLACAALAMGTTGWESIKAKGGRVVLWEEPFGRRLEDRLVGN